MQQPGRQLTKFNVCKTLLDVSQSATKYGLHAPSALMLPGTTLLQLDQVGKVLNSRIDPNTAIRRDATEAITKLMNKLMNQQATQGSVLNSILEMRDFVTGLPVRLNKIMGVIGNAELEVKVRAVDARLLMEGAQKIANRIAFGIILAVLIIGASLLMRVETPFRLFGYPALAILCFLAAAADGLWLVIGIFVQDQKKPEKITKVAVTSAPTA